MWHPVARSCLFVQLWAQGPWCSRGGRIDQFITAFSQPPSLASPSTRPPISASGPHCLRSSRSSPSGALPDPPSVQSMIGSETVSSGVSPTWLLTLARYLVTTPLDPSLALVAATAGQGLGSCCPNLGPTSLPPCSPRSVSCYCLNLGLGGGDWLFASMVIQHLVQRGVLVHDQDPLDYINTNSNSYFQGISPHSRRRKPKGFCKEAHRKLEPAWGESNGQLCAESDPALAR